MNVRTMGVGMVIWMAPLLVGGCASGRDTRPVSVTTSPEPRAVTVTGEAEVKVVPDEAVMTVGAETTDPNITAAKSKNDEAVRKIIAAATAAGVDPKHIQTEYMELEPRYRDNYDRREVLSYIARKAMIITIKRLDRFEAIVSAVVESGANMLSGVQFRTTELRKHKDQARQLAIRAAKEKATALAKELDQEIDRPHLIEEEQTYSWFGYGGWFNRYGGGQSQNIVQNAGSASPSGDSTLAPGQIAITARVRVKFELR